MLLDFTTLLVLNLIVNVINLGAMTLLWRRYRDRYAGLSFWTQAMAVHVLGIGLILFRTALPLFFTAVVANGLLMSSTLLMLAGFQGFTGTVARRTHNLVAFAVYLLSLSYFSVLVPDIDARNICNSVIIILVNAQTCWLLFRQVPDRMRRITFYAGVLMACYVAVSLARIVILLSFPRESALFRSGLADSVAIASFIALHVCLIIALALTIVRRLMDDVLANEEKFVKAFQLAPYALIISRRDDLGVVEVNEGFCGMFGHSRFEALGKSLPTLLWPAGRPGESLPPEAFTGPGHGEKREIQAQRKSGETMIGELVSEEIAIDGQAHVLSTINDITGESRLRQRLEELATTDSLTGLPNRRFFYERFDIARPLAGRRRTRMAVMSIDLDRFKSVNDTLGHAAGDAVLVEAARRLAESLRHADVVSRFGGDEFVVLLTEVRGVEDASRVAEKIVAAFRRPFEVAGRPVAITASLGFAVFPEHGEDLEALLKRSDEALYESKRAGRDGYAVAGWPGG